MSVVLAGFCVREDLWGVTSLVRPLPPDLLNRILRENYLAFKAKKSSGTEITRAMDWSQMGVERQN
jgi:hypothetical protein